MPTDSSDSDGPPTSISFIGIGVAIAGNILISLALNLQKLAHRRINRAARRAGRGRPNGIGVVLEEDEGEGNGREGGPDGVVDLGEEPDTPRPPKIVIAPNSTPSRPPPYKLTSPPPSSPQPTDRLLSPTSPSARLQPRRYNSLPRSDGGEEPKEGRGRKTYLRSRLWWAGLLVMTVGETGNFLSYAYAPASIVAPLGTVALIANCLFAPLMLGERLRRLELFGVALAIVGAITVVASSNTSDVRLSPEGLLRALSQPQFIAYTAVYAVSACVLVFLSSRPIGEKSILIDIGLCALFGGFTVLATKALSSMLTLQGPVIFAEWITYPVILVLAGTAIGQIRHLNRALQRFDSKIVVPTQFTLFNFSAILGSAVLYHDFANVSFHRFVVFLYGIATTFAGVFCLTYRPREFFAASPPQQQQQTQTQLQEEGQVFFRDPSAPTSPIGGPPLVLPHPPAGVLHTRQSAASLGLSPGKYLLIPTGEPVDEEDEENDADDEGDEGGGGGGAAASILPLAFGRQRRVSTGAVPVVTRTRSGSGVGQGQGVLSRPAALWRPASVQ